MDLMERIKDNQAYIRASEFFGAWFRTMDLRDPQSQKDESTPPEHSFWDIFSSTDAKGERLSLMQRIRRGYESGRHAANRVAEIPGRIRDLIAEEEEEAPIARLALGEDFDMKREREKAEEAWRARTGRAAQGAAGVAARSSEREEELQRAGQQAAQRMASRGRPMKSLNTPLIDESRRLPPPPKGLPAPPSSKGPKRGPSPGRGRDGRER